MGFSLSRPDFIVGEAAERVNAALEARRMVGNRKSLVGGKWASLGTTSLAVNSRSLVGQISASLGTTMLVASSFLLRLGF